MGYVIAAKRFGDLCSASILLHASPAFNFCPVLSSALLNMAKGAEPTESIDRERRIGIIENLFTLAGSVASLKAAATGQATPQSNPIYNRLATLLEPVAKDRIVIDRQRKELQLAHDLICKVAGVDERALHALAHAIRVGKDGHANALAVKINQALASRLNFPRVWAQDRQFALIVTPRDYELVFTIKDRTGSEYSFAERSSGLKYFLSYYIQYLAYEPSDSKTEVLLMDEPDAFLSSQAQQDLLRIFNAFAEGENGRKPVQVIYVTHSPFLIDKNHSERIRVLEKGTGDEGTRVVKSAAQNHYEPLRSSFGAFLGETAFIGNCNLFVEGPADQIILGAAAKYLRLKNVPEADNLDLNHITIVPAGGTSHIPYLVYLARGRSIERPAAIVLLDSDKAGKTAHQNLLREPIRKKTLLKQDYVFEIADLSNFGKINTATQRDLIELEDLIPIPMAISTLRRYAREFWGMSAEEADMLFTEEKLSMQLIDNRSLFDAIECMVNNPMEAEQSIDKVAFARTFVALLPQSFDELSKSASLAGLAEFDANMKVLFRKLSQMQRKAERELSAERVGRKLERVKRRFVQDYPVSVTKEKAALMLEELLETLDSSAESDDARIRIQALHREFALDEDRLEHISRYDVFQEKLEQIQYAGILISSTSE